MLNIEVTQDYSLEIVVKDEALTNLHYLNTLRNGVKNIKIDILYKSFYRKSRFL